MQPRTQSTAQHSIADDNGDSTHGFLDMPNFLTDYNTGDTAADFNANDQLNYLDVIAILATHGPLDGTDFEHWHSTYDFRNQLVGVTWGFGTATPTGTTNTYDALARRVLETSLNQTKQMVYGGVSHWEVLEQIDLSQSPQQVLTTHVYGIGIDDEVSYRIEDLMTPEDKWTHRDDLNSLTSITDESGDVDERYEYGDYGQVSIFDASGNALAASSFSAQHLYTGRIQIGGSGLYDLRFRVLDPETGRFVQRDPLGYVDTANLFIYASSSPYGLIDTYGLDDKVIYSSLGDNLGGNPVAGIFPSWVITVINIIESAGYGYETHTNVTLVDVALDLITRNDKVTKVYLSGHGSSENSQGGKSGARFRNPKTGMLDPVDADLLEKILANQKCPKDKRNPILTKYYNILNTIFNYTDEVDWFSCNTFKGTKGKKFQDALNSLGWGDKSVGHFKYVADPNYFDGRGSATKSRKRPKPSAPASPSSGCGGCPPPDP